MFSHNKKSLLFLLLVKIKLTLEQATKAQKGNSGIALPFL